MSAAVNDPVLKFFESGGTSASSSNDPIYDFLDTGKVPDSMPSFEEAKQIKNNPKGSWWNSFKAVGRDALDFGGGIAETIASPVGNFAAAVPATVVGLGNQLFGSQKEENPGDRFLSGFHSVADPVSKLLEPETETGKYLQKKIGQAFDFLPEEAGEVAFEKSGPLAGAAAKTATAGAEMVLTGKAMQGLSKLAKSITTKEEVKPEAKTEQEKAEPEKPETKPPEKVLDLSKQMDRAKVLQRVGIEKARTSSLTGDAKAAASDYQQSKLDNPGGDLMRTVLDQEKQALQTHTEKVVKDTGGTIGMAEDDLHARGTTIASPFDSIRDELSKTRKKLYTQADEAAEGGPGIKLDSLAEFLKKDSAFEGKAENGSLRKGILSYLREQHILETDGSLKPISAKSAEGLRQYINDQWSPGTSGLAGKIKGLIDSDVLDKSENVYKPARDLHKKIKDTLENPSGISKLMDFDPRNPVNRSVPYEKIPDFVTRLPTDQFKHVIDVLKEAPEGIKPKADIALGEIKAHIVNKILAEGNKYKGQWNAKGVSKILADSSAKMKLIFTPEEMARLADLDKAGHILNTDTSYPGASVQEHNLLVRGAMKSLPAIGTGIGAVAAGPVGAVGGELAGSALAKRIGQRSSLSSAEKRLTNLSDMVKK